MCQVCKERTFDAHPANYRLYHVVSGRRVQFAGPPRSQLFSRPKPGGEVFGTTQCGSGVSAAEGQSMAAIRHPLFIEKAALGRRERGKPGASDQRALYIPGMAVIRVEFAMGLSLPKGQ